jgi:spore coat polysaccharide biosynthesis predicted glycosyltransferase SpsG
MRFVKSKEIKNKELILGFNYTVLRDQFFTMKGKQQLRNKSTFSSLCIK